MCESIFASEKRNKFELLCFETFVEPFGTLRAQTFLYVLFFWFTQLTSLKRAQLKM